MHLLQAQGWQKHKFIVVNLKKGKNIWWHLPVNVDEPSTKYKYGITTQSRDLWLPFLFMPA